MAGETGLTATMWARCFADPVSSPLSLSRSRLRNRPARSCMSVGLLMLSNVAKIDFADFAYAGWRLGNGCVYCTDL
ncbi:hypothetical protein KCP70_13630 [Salmonella enterica subsp. enterica]|nr:hypothetical protein KCP70_13630 [Salmonella enterica subsp. enterica]